MKILLLTYFFFEVIITITLGGKIGGLNTFLEIVLSAVVGVLVMINFKKVFMHNLTAVMTKQMSAKDLMTSNVLGLIGAVLLVIPGFLSDAIGLLLQVGFIRNILATQIKAPQTQTKHSTYKGDDDVIDVEIIEHKPTDK